MSVKRFDILGKHYEVFGYNNGKYCLYEDYAALEARCAALAAENAGLINSSVFTLQDGRPPYGFYASEWFIAKLKNGEYAALKALPEEYSYDYRTNDGTYYTKDWVVGWMQTPDTEYRPNVKTPATDAFLAEVRAQVWIEGNEPAEFGRYWVRYETDVGPQYCSAKWMEHNFCAGSDTNIHKIWLADHSRSINSLKGVTHYTMLPESIEGGAK
ncbi:hypothetical protein ACOY7N_13180 [Enterobacter asburiae]|uniref:hypothetical protein n=1 Tax=Enterobacter asburiae TaxID=61645 RepID=UPI003BE04DD6